MRSLWGKRVNLKKNNFFVTFFLSITSKVKELKLLTL